MLWTGPRRVRILFSSGGSQRVALPATERNPLSLLTPMRTRAYSLLAVFAVAMAIYYPFSPGGRQARNIRKAEEFIAQNAAAVNADPRFKEVEFSSCTAADGSLLIDGTVSSAADASELRHNLASRLPSIVVGWHVYVAKPATTMPTTGPQG
jgi:hypothetical protein